MEDDLEHFEVITLDNDADSFVDDDGIYQFINGTWYEAITEISSVEKVILH